MKSDEGILRRLMRRLRSARASVMLEFAFVAPLIAITAVFAADFTRILRTEQQLEIGARLAADVEAHMADYYGEGESPCKVTKLVCKYYLVNVAHVADEVADVYMKGACETIRNPISVAVAALKDFLSGKTFDVGDDSFAKLFVNVLGKIVGGIMNFLTFNTLTYVTDVVPHDREVKVSVAAYISTILPEKAYSFFSLPSRTGGKIGVGQFVEDLEGGAAATAWNLKINQKKRHRVYCYMPIVDSVPIAPETYIRIIKRWCANQPFLKGLVE